jgi:hypothetical protein
LCNCGTGKNCTLTHSANISSKPPLAAKTLRLNPHQIRQRSDCHVQQLVAAYGASPILGGMRILPILFCLLLLGCGRTLVPEETAFLADLQGPTFETSRIRLIETSLIGLNTREFAVRPQTTCRERILPPPEGPTVQARTAGLVLFHTVYVRPNWYVENYLEGAPEQLPLMRAMFLAHEMTHVWQWQNRDLTGYHPLRVAAEHTPGADPYLFQNDPDRAFLDYGFEQQASLVEEFVCCNAVAPEGARTHRLAALLRQVMPLGAYDRHDAQSRVLLPWGDADLRGICD